VRVFQPTRTRDEEINRNLDKIAASIGDAAREMASQGAGLVAYPVKSFEITTEAMVAFRGGASQTITLPGSLSYGNGITREITIWNDSASALTVAGQVGDRLSGSTTVASAAVSIWRSDGAMAWVRVL